MYRAEARPRRLNSANAFGNHCISNADVPNMRFREAASLCSSMPAKAHHKHCFLQVPVTYCRLASKPLPGERLQATCSARKWVSWAARPGLLLLSLVVQIFWLRGFRCLGLIRVVASEFRTLRLRVDLALKFANMASREPQAKTTSSRMDSHPCHEVI